MIIEYYSDIHNEFRSTFWYPDAIEKGRKEETKKVTLVLAGDIDTDLSQLDTYLTTLAYWYKHVVFVPGNHEYYGHEMTQHRKDLKRLEEGADNIYVLDNEHIILDDVILYGSTLWTDLNKMYALDGVIAQGISDFSHIRMGSRKFTPQDAREEFDESCEGMVIARAEAHTLDLPTVFITHFPPSSECQIESREWTAFSYYFTPSVPPALFSGVDCWIYGHTHEGKNIEIDGCNILSNQLGYPHESSGETIKAEYIIV